MNQTNIATPYLDTIRCDRHPTIIHAVTQTCPVCQEEAEAYQLRRRQFEAHTVDADEADNTAGDITETLFAVLRYAVPVLLAALLLGLWMQGNNRRLTDEVRQITREEGRR